MQEPLLMAAANVKTFGGNAHLTGASGFFYQTGERLFVVTSRHVLFDDATGHRPDRIEIELHIDEADLAQTTGFSMPLYRDGTALWREATDRGGEVDVAAPEIDRAALPRTALLRPFEPAHQVGEQDEVEIGANILVIGFPLGFHDPLHRLPVARHAIVASSFGLRFQGQGYFLTDARTHRGISGAPVVMRAPIRSADGPRKELPWILLGVHSTRLDLATREPGVDEALGLNCAWYADVLATLTAG